jgi:hypothetical protein
VLLESTDRFLLNELRDGLDEFVVSWMQIYVEDAGHENGIANLERPSIGIPDQLGDDVVACDLACHAFGHIVLFKPHGDFLVASDVTYNKTVARGSNAA